MRFTEFDRFIHSSGKAVFTLQRMPRPTIEYHQSSSFFSHTIDWAPALYKSPDRSISSQVIHRFQRSAVKSLNRNLHIAQPRHVKSTMLSRRQESFLTAGDDVFRAAHAGRTARTVAAVDQRRKAAHHENAPAAGPARVSIVGVRHLGQLANFGD